MVDDANGGKVPGQLSVKCTNRAHNNPKSLERMFNVSRGCGSELTCECVVLAKDHLGVLGFTDDSTQACDDAMLSKAPAQYFVDGSYLVLYYYTASEGRAFTFLVLFGDYCRSVPISRSIHPRRNDVRSTPTSEGYIHNTVGLRVRFLAK